MVTGVIVAKTRAETVNGLNAFLYFKNVSDGRDWQVKFDIRIGREFFSEEAEASKYLSFIQLLFYICMCNRMMQFI